MSPEVQRREQEKTLNLLRFALDRDGVDPRSFVIAQFGETLPETEDRITLLGDNDSWQVFYQERGVRRIMGTFSSLYDATRFFFTQLTDPTSFYRHRETWEAETGQSFSMMP